MYVFPFHAVSTRNLKISNYLRASGMVALAVFGFVCCILTACTPQGSSNRLLVATAASTQFYAFEMSDAFSARYGVEVEVVVGSSGMLTTQILNGAPFDIFLSADSSFASLLYDRGVAIYPPKIFGVGTPVLWSLKKHFHSIDSALVQTPLGRIAIANPKNAPYGLKARQFLEDRRLLELLSDNLVYGESLAQVNEYVIRQNVDFGFSAESSLLADQLREKGQYMALAPGYEVKHTVVALNNGKDPVLMDQFLSFMSSEQGMVFLQKYGLDK